ncbi:hypothetical protein [Hoeflea prorocentri]|uniref:Autotransporter domain-containing protein n=1 Tax=Hoeflea prorocentri TaxID=1922333 RepID=A0A9X3ULT7_9HYPH|nr:hypothetical protein [Hoeflea prorocentri]MCY6381559.1 hypothetical protein [Hoeflea prorocentri]MDA5399359.1 hypothetical protein [Hoeflea prorocentri]
MRTRERQRARTDEHWSNPGVAFAALAGSFFVYCTVPAIADCSTSGTTTTCNGDLDLGETVDLDDVTEVKIENLTNDSGPLVFSDIADPGADTTSVDVSFDGSSQYGASASGETVLTVGLQGGAGAAALAGSNGSDGGSAGFINLTLDNATDFDGESIFSLESRGGDGGEGYADNEATDGGQGGAAGLQTIKIGSGGIGKVTSYQGIVFNLVSSGGNGGTGGGGNVGTGNGLGGDGGVGGAAGDLTVEVDSGDISDLVGDESILVFAASKGGDGGAGGSASSTDTTHAGDGGTGAAAGNISVALSFSETVSVGNSSDGRSIVWIESVGGTGGDGGKAEPVWPENGHGGDGAAGAAAGTVDVSLSGVSLATTGEMAAGVLARSLGGGGGKRGKSTRGSGGSYGSLLEGGTADRVFVEFDGEIETLGQFSTGILLQSIGGFGGTAGVSTSVQTYGTNERSGGDGGQAELILAAGAGVQTHGDNAEGVLVQSVGGGGGKAMDSDGVTTVGGAKESIGDGGDAVATLIDGASIFTGGTFSAGAVVQSIGGGGGVMYSDDDDDDIAIRAEGDAYGGNGGTATVDLNDGSRIETNAAYSAGVIAQSIGAGGGIARSTDTGVTSIGAKKSSPAGDGGTVSAALDGMTITTMDVGAGGVVLQSIGAGGGYGVSDVTPEAKFSQRLGGTGGGGGDGGGILVNSGLPGSITTTGDLARGLMAQSVAGGGYSVNDLSVGEDITIVVSFGQVPKVNEEADDIAESIGSGGFVEIVDTYFTIGTSGDNAHGLLAQSVADGGGSSATAIDYTSKVMADTAFWLGGEGGRDSGSSSGGVVDVTVDAQITTGGNIAHGVIAQSIGGGGGEAGFVLTGDEVSEAKFTAEVGGTNGQGGSADKVTVTVNDVIGTSGHGSHAILAQSIGAGGGAGGWTSSIGSMKDADHSLSLGQSITTNQPERSGLGGQVEVYHQSGLDLTTTGDGAVAILAQSVGGGGGSLAMILAGDVTSGTGVDLTVGNDSSYGTDADTVTVLTDGSIGTQGDGSIGILAQSISNSGGYGSYVASADTFDVDGFTAKSQGGTISDGMSGDVSLEAIGSVTTLGDHASALFGQSVAGGGGVSIALVSASDLALDSLSVSLGSSEGKKGTAGDVVVQNTASLGTSGANSHGIFAQSLGGSGGYTGIVAQADLSTQSFATDVSLKLGGDSGSKNTSGMVEVTNNGGIITQGYRSRGIVAQTMGGAGGEAGLSYSGVLSPTSGQTLTTEVTIGNLAGSSGTVGDAKVYNYQEINTGGFYSDAIFAQSVGAGGGSGGNAFVLSNIDSTDVKLSVSVAVGGEGGQSSDGGTVYVENTAKLQTGKAGSSGIYAQSIGGVGGRADTAGAVLLNFLDIADGNAVAVDMIFTLGGTSGNSADGNTVTIVNDGEIDASGEASRGIFAQSIGGGGGDAGIASAYSVTQLMTSHGAGTNTSSLDASFAVGGNGATGGDGNTVSIANSARIGTDGLAGHGIFAQSIGGGGGTGGDGQLGSPDFATDFQTAFYDAGDIEEVMSDYVFADADTLTNLNSWYNDILATDTLTVSSTLTSWSMSIGGQDGALGSGAEVSITGSGDISTTGDHAAGIFAQSIGGGGGAGGIGGGDLLTDVTIGGLGGGAGDGGVVAINYHGAVTTAGQGAMGIFAQSVGGGGGAAGNIALALSSSFSTDSFGLGVVGGGTAGDGGNGGEVTIVAHAITTTGENGHGIFAQSIGGGGGAAGIDDGTTVTANVGNAGDTGDGGAVNVTVNDTLSVSGDYSAAIFAQSLGGSAGNGGDITINLNAGVSSSGTGGWGIVAQSDGDASAGDVTINIAEGGSLSTTGTSANEPITVLSAATLTINNDGTLSGGDINAGLLNSSAPVNTINNNGTITGEFALSDSSTNTFNNMSGGVFETGKNVNLGEDGVLDNAGSISIGGADKIIETIYEGTLTTTSGTFLFDLEMGGPLTDNDADYLTFEIQTTTYTPTGTLEVNLTGTNLKTSGDSGKIGIMYAGGPDNLDIDNLTVTDGAVVDYSLDKESGGEAKLSYTVDFSSVVSLLSANQAEIHDLVEELIAARIDELESSTSTTTTALAVPSVASASVAPAAAASGSSFAFIESIATSVLGAASASELAALYDRLAPGDVFVAADAALYSSYRFSEMLGGCEAQKPSGHATHYWDSTCAWIQMGGTSHNRDRSTNSIDYDENAFAMAAGVRSEIATDWMLGFALGFENISQSNTTFNSDGYRIQTGVMLTRTFGATELSGSISGGYSQYDFTRYAFHTSGWAAATAKPNLAWGSGHMRLAHAFAVNDRVTVKPSFSTGVTHIRQGAFSETGAGDYQLHIGTIENTLFSFNPSVDVISNFQLGGMAAKATFHAGFLAFAGDVTSSTTAQFSVGGPAFTLIDEAERYFANLGVNIEAQINDRFTFEAGVDALFSSDVQNYGGGVGLKMKF